MAQSSTFYVKQFSSKRGYCKNSFSAFGPPARTFSEIWKKLELRKDLAYETLQTRTRYDISFVSYRRSYFDNKNQIKGLRPARSRNWANLNSLLDEGFVRLQNAAKLNFLGQTVLELGRVLWKQFFGLRPARVRIFKNPKKKLELYTA